MKKGFLVAILLLALFSLPLYFHSDDSEADRPHGTADPSTNGGSAPWIREIHGVVKPGETMVDIFRKYGLGIQQLFHIRKATAGIHKLRKISVGQPYKIGVSADKAVMSLTYQIDDDILLSVTREEPGFKAEKVQVAYEKRIGRLGGLIEDNLCDALEKDGKSTLLALDLSDIFSWDVDFTTDLRKGDTFKIVVEELWLDGRFKRYGDILAAEFVNDGKTFAAFRYEVDGRAGYFDDEGRSLRKSFLKAPLSYRRISSGFSYSRLHPILRIRRPHLGVDYVAPAGTPVSALGDGTVLFAGYKGANGNLVILRHAMGFTTYYGHLSRTGKGIRRGARVGQGEVIGYVGATGRATGPHLDFRVKKHSRFINPLSVDVPRARGIPAALLADFRQVRSGMSRELASVSLLSRFAKAPGNKIGSGQTVR
ncbi:MAG TPA: peptidoglycan DD-metalloendopeptidase family protein [Candidatus Limnocylindrales bacterium]|nr:peptidoglycan DD-metalloendopeptidase family protein [Candidatus Limnocylindrales bacterium]